MEISATFHTIQINLLSSSLIRIFERPTSHDTAWCGVAVRGRNLNRATGS